MIHVYPPGNLNYMYIFHQNDTSKYTEFCLMWSCKRPTERDDN